MNAPSAHLRLARNTALSAIAIALLGLSRLLFNVVTGRRFGPDALGQATLAVNTAMFATLAISGGWQASTARYLSQSLGAGKPGEAAWIYRRSLLHNTAGGAVAGAGCWAWLAMSGNGLPARDAFLAGVIAFAYNAYQHLKSASYGFGRVERYVRAEASSSALLIGGLLLVAIAKERSVLLTPVAAAYAFFSVWTLAALRDAAAHPSPPAAEEWRRVKSFTVLAALGTIFSAGFLNLSPIFARGFDSPERLGMFSAALALVVPVYFLPRALSLALFPSIAFRYGQERIDDVKRQLEQAGRGVAVLLLVPCALAAALARPVMSLVFGERYEAGAGLLAILIGATYLSVVQIPFVTALSGTERRWYRVPVLASGIGFATGVAAWMILGRRYGATGIAWGYLIGSVPQALIPIVFASRVFGIRVGLLGARIAVVWLLATLAWPLAIGIGWSAAAAMVAFAMLFGGETAAIFAKLRRRNAG